MTYPYGSYPPLFLFIVEAEWTIGILMAMAVMSMKRNKKAYIFSAAWSVPICYLITYFLNNHFNYNMNRHLIEIIFLLIFIHGAGLDLAGIGINIYVWRKRNQEEDHTRKLSYANSFQKTLILQKPAVLDLEGSGI
ncbi:MAG: hypothetical protein HQK54_13850, partial [Oligoflexales bacterium]|nr:hypothetical protein [Oligoflexales bacterium]